MFDFEGALYVYINKSGNPSVAYSHTNGRDIPYYHYYEDEIGETTQLEALMSIVEEGDGVIVGSITDFMTPNVQNMVDTLEFFESKGVRIFSRLEPKYDVIPYRDAVILANNIARKRYGLEAE